MSREDDIRTIVAQEQALQFDRFDEVTAYAIGSEVRRRAEAESLGLVVDVRLWDRPLFYCAMPGTTSDNPEWVRRKVNTVRRLGGDTRLFPPHRALDPADHALAGGAFPIRVKALAGPVGTVTISGLHERDDHMVAVAAVCAVLGRDPGEFALGAQ